MQGSSLNRFDQDRIEQADAVILAAATTDGITLERPKARSRFPGIEDDGPGANDGVGELTRDAVREAVKADSKSRGSVSTRKPPFCFCSPWQRTHWAERNV